MHENIIYIYIYIYICHFASKTGLYFYNIKIHKINTHKKQRYYSFFLRAGSSSAHVAGLNQAGLAGSQA
jgi:hypothetical protein